MMKILITFVLLILSGCSLDYGDFKPTPLNPPLIKKTVRIFGLPLCEKAFQETQKYFLSHGIQVENRPDSEYALLCLKDSYFITRVFAMLFNPVREASGQVTYFQTSGSGFVKMQGSLQYNTKIMIHELTHMWFKAPHKATGIMFPISTFLDFATGLDDKTLQEIKKTNNFTSYKACTECR